MKKSFFLFSLMAGLVLGSFAFTNPENGETETLKVDTEASEVVWKGYKVTGQHHGTIKIKEKGSKKKKNRKSRKNGGRGEARKRWRPPMRRQMMVPPPGSRPPRTTPTRRMPRRAEHQTKIHNGRRRRNSRVKVPRQLATFPRTRARARGKG